MHIIVVDSATCRNECALMRLGRSEKFSDFCELWKPASGQYPGSYGTSHSKTPEKLLALSLFPKAVIHEAIR